MTTAQRDRPSARALPARRWVRRPAGDGGNFALLAREREANQRTEQECVDNAAHCPREDTKVDHIDQCRLPGHTPDKTLMPKVPEASALLRVDYANR